jgi:hypothetical protein
MIQRKPRFVFKKSDRSGVFLLGLLVLFIGAPSLIGTSEAELEGVSPFERESIPETARSYWANHLSDFDLYRLGMGVEETKHYRKYRGQGQYFRSVEEFRTVLGLRDATTFLDSALLFPSYKPALSHPSQIPKKQKLNTASARQLQKVKGVGPVLSNRIVGYRKLLGGFADLHQLHEVYALDTAVVNTITKHFYLETEPQLRRLDVQRESASDLAKHPYLDSRQASRLVLHRELLDRPLTEEDLRVLLDVSNKRFNRIKLYLYFQN